MILSTVIMISTLIYNIILYAKYYHPQHFIGDPAHSSSLADSSLTVPSLNLPSILSPPLLPPHLAPTPGALFSTCTSAPVFILASIVNARQYVQQTELSMLVSQDCHGKDHILSGLNSISLLTQSSESRNLKSRCWEGCSF